MADTWQVMRARAYGRTPTLAVKTAENHLRLKGFEPRVVTIMRQYSATVEGRQWLCTIEAVEIET